MDGLSVIIPWRYSDARYPLLANVINCIRQQSGVNYELIVVEQTTREKMIEKKILSILPTNDTTYKQVVSESPDFNKSWLMNIAAKKAKYDYLLFIDADTMFEKDYFQKIKIHIQERADTHLVKVFFCWTILMALPGKDNPNLRAIRPENTVAMGGIWCAEKKFYFEKLKGMNESFMGYGGEDNDAYERASYLLNCPIFSFMMNYTLTHQYHDWEPANKNAAKYSSNTRQHTKIIQERLDTIEMGNEDQPTVIDMEIKEEPK